MELNVTHMVEDADSMCRLSGSRMEWGNDAGKFTWNNSIEYGKERPLLDSDEARDEARRHFRSYGAWSEEEIAAWSEEELQGIMCQDVAAVIREIEDLESIGEAGRLSRGDDGQWYFYLGD